MKKFMFALVIVTNLFSNAAEAISCPNVPPGKKTGDKIVVDGMTWKLAIGAPDSLEVNKNGITWPARSSGGYRYYLHRSMPVCAYLPDHMIIPTTLQLETGQAVGVYICNLEAADIEINCATNSFIPDMRNGDVN